MARFEPPRSRTLQRCCTVKNGWLSRREQGLEQTGGSPPRPAPHGQTRVVSRPIRHLLHSPAGTVAGPRSSYFFGPSLYSSSLPFRGFERRSIVSGKRVPGGESQDTVSPECSPPPPLPLARSPRRSCTHHDRPATARPLLGIRVWLILFHLVSGAIWGVLIPCIFEKGEGHDC